MRYTTSDRSAVSDGHVCYPLDHPVVRAFLDQGGTFGEPLIELHDDLAYIRDVERAEIVNEALDLLKRQALQPVAEEARNANPTLFSNTDPMGEALERAREANAIPTHKDDDLNPQAPSDWDMDGQGVVEGVEAVPAPTSAVPEAIALLMLDGESIKDAKARNEHPELFSNAEAADPEKEALRDQVADLQRQLAERDAEPPPLSPDPVKHMIPDEIRKLMEDGESLSNAKRRLTELLWVEQAELRNLRGTDRGDLKREAEIERLLGLFARLGEI
jgi:hypothetical protein